MAEPRNYRANAAGTPPDPLSAPSTGYPTTEVPGVTDPTYPGEYWYYQVGEELRKAIVEGGLTPAYDSVDQLSKVLGKLFGRTNNGDPNGVLAADRLHERCWDNSVQPPALYIATAADGTVAGTVWEQVSQNRSLVVFDTPGVTSWAVPEGVSKVLVTVVGGGGAGGRSTGSNKGPGGGGGGASKGWVDVSAKESVDVTVGAGGAAVTSDGGSANNGESSSFGSFLSAEGGNGASGDSGAEGGQGTGGDLNIGGAVASDGEGAGGTGDGGSSFMGGGGRGADSSGSPGEGRPYGGGGGGTPSGSNSGSGADGVVVIEW